MILAAETITPAFYYIPGAALAAIVICAALPLIELSIAKDLWKLGKVLVLLKLALLAFLSLCCRAGRPC